jgi:hypothetical protein
VREDGRIVGGEEWQEKVYNREEWKKLLRMARYHRILPMPVECVLCKSWHFKPVAERALKLLEVQPQMMSF